MRRASLKNPFFVEVTMLRRGKVPPAVAVCIASRSLGVPDQ